MLTRSCITVSLNNEVLPRGAAVSYTHLGVSIVEVKDGKARVLQENVIYYDEKRSTNYIE